MPKNKKKKRNDKTGADKLIIKSVLIGSAAGIVCFFALTSILTLLAYTQDLEESYYTALIFFASGSSAFAGGFTAVLPLKRNGLVLGLLSVLPTFFFIAGVAGIVSRTGIGVLGWIALGIMLTMGALGGIIAANKRKRVKIK